MESTIPSRSERQPLLRHVSPQPVDDDDQLSASEACHTQEHDTGHNRSADITLKLLATSFSFLLLGYLVARPGIIPISSVGYIAGALLNQPIHRRFGQRGIAIIAPIFQLTYTILASTYFDPGQAHFVVFLFIRVVGNFGFGLLHGSWSAWAGGLGERSNTVQGLLHGSLAVGAGLVPVVVVVGVPWLEMWYVLHGAVILQWVLLCWAFRFDDGKRYRDALETSRPGGLNEASRATPVVRPRGALGYAVTWICAAYFFFYVGTETAMSGWVTFILRARDATTDLATLSSSGFWLGMGAGRILLGLATDRLGVRMATASYLVVAIVFQGIMIAVNQAVVSIIAVSLVGFFLGPVFPSGIVMITRLLPKELHVKAVSLVASVGQLGAAVGPIVMGPLVQSLGLQGSQAIILAILVVTLLIWCLFTRFPDTDIGLDHTAHMSPDATG
ncbi:hypothetical protein VMCG_05721 [Cytospora schulzeri]|uniref:Major facilitator superfamily (MFS) profile domain-containing protein n=1 Tax=Cytospora schulzeri TaxID=448051 RepID=A0A423WI29_9PEZI|nr:hypothetical protein VMCG_05721 [Valsa malicola]